MRTEISVDVQGLEKVQALRSEVQGLTSDLKSVKEVADGLQGAFSAFNRSASSAGKQAENAGNQVRELRASLIDLKTTAGEGVTTLNRVGQAAEGVGRGFNLGLGTMLKWRIAGAIFSDVERAITDVTKAYAAFDYQAARTTRLTGPQDRGYTIAALREGSAMSGRPAEDSGEAWYQISTYLKTATDRADAYRAAMGLVTGTEADTRDATRALIQVFEQFGDQLPKNLTDGEKFGRIAEMMAVDFKDANLEVNEWVQSMKYLGPIAEATNIRLEQAAAIISTLSAVGQRGRMAGTGPSQLLMNLVSNYNSELGGLEFKGSVYHYDLPIDKQGYVDAIKMIESVVARIQQLKAEGPEGTKRAEEFARAVSGSVQGMRALMGLASENGMTKLYQELQRNSDALRGQTHELEKLKAAMQDTFSVTASRVWQSFLGDVSEKLDEVAQKLGIIQKLNAAADSHEAKDWAKTENLKEAAQLETEDPLTHIRHLRELTRQAIDEARTLQIEQGVKPKYDKNGREIQTSFDLGFLYRPEDMMHREGISESGMYALKAVMKQYGMLGGPNEDQFSLNNLFDLQEKYLPAEERRLKRTLGNQASPSATGAVIGQHLQDAFGTAPVQAACAWLASKILEASGLALTKNGGTINSASALKDTLIGQYHAQLIETLRPGQQPNQAQTGDIAFFYGPKYGTTRDKRGSGWHVGLMEDRNTIVQGGDYGAREEKPFGISQGGTAFIYRLPGNAIEKAYQRGAAITDAPDKNGTSLTEAIQGKIALDKALLQRLEDQGLSFPDFKRKALGIGADWEHQQAENARKSKMDPNAEKAELLLIHTGHSDFADYLAKKKDEYNRDLAQQKKDNDDAARERQDQTKEMAAAHYEYAKHYFGVNDPRTLAAARQADRLAYASTTSDERFNMEKGLSGKVAENAQDVKQAAANLAEKNKELWKTLFDRFREDALDAADRQVSAIQRGLRSDNIFAKPDEIGALKEEQAIWQGVIDKIQASGEKSKDAQDEIGKLTEKIADLGAQIVNTQDRIKAEQFREGMQRQQQDWDEARKEIDRKMPRRDFLTQKDADTYELARRAAFRDEIVKEIGDLTSLSVEKWGMPNSEADKKHRSLLEDLNRQLKEATFNLADYSRQIQESKVIEKLRVQQDKLQRTEGALVSGALAIAHGQPVGRTLGDMARQVFDENLQAQLKKWLDPSFKLDPHVQAVKETTQAVKETTQAVKEVRDAVQGKQPGGTQNIGTAQGLGGGELSGIGAGVLVGLPFLTSQNSKSAAETLSPYGLTTGDVHDHVKESGTWFKAANAAASAVSAAAGAAKAGGAAAGAGKAGAKLTPGDYIGAGLQAYGFLQNLGDAGPIGGLLSGAATGASLGSTFGGPAGAGLGAGIGGVVGLIGGLFGGHHHEPQQTPQQLDPALYNTPSTFDYYFYRSRAFPASTYATAAQTLKDVGFQGFKTNAPMVGPGGVGSVPDWMVNSGLYPGSSRQESREAASRSAPVQVNVYVDGQKQAARVEIARQIGAAPLDGHYYNNVQPTY